ncbi:hypothetical protein JTE90_009059 [Oedothorax gibbosus]|uniref:Uncharacterized protein n=1 Tax=Oedothorax gibbosus TaxID=931172 RepID=A0AAV6VIK2_9ARAC|nr:hypothetical protein JTE90_009059 [Oedothorax gibbosus]
MNSFLTSLLVLLSACVVLEAQLRYDVVPVGTISRLSANGEREVISSVGGAKVGIYRKVYPPRPLYVVPRYPPLVPRYPPVPVVKKPYPTKKPGKLETNSQTFSKHRIQLCYENVSGPSWRLVFFARLEGSSSGRFFLPPDD